MSCNYLNYDLVRGATTQDDHRHAYFESLIVGDSVQRDLDTPRDLTNRHFKV